jgi:hypothetical protein
MQASSDTASPRTRLRAGTSIYHMEVVSRPYSRDSLSLVVTLGPYFGGGSASIFAFSALR